MFCVLFVSYLSAQTGVWSKNSSTINKERHKTSQRDEFPKVFETFSLNEIALKNSLSEVLNTNKNTVLSFPNANGQLEQFQMIEASNFDAELQARFPEIRAYIGIGITDKKAQLRLSSGPLGFQGMILRAGGVTEFFEPLTSDRSVYAIYKSQREKGKLPFTCSSTDVSLENEIAKNTATTLANNTTFKTMRLAISCTAEYSNYFGASSAAQVNLVLAAFNATLTRVNGINEKDLALRLLLVSQTTNVIYYNAATDPYSDGTTGSAGAWNTELQNTLSSSLTGPSTTLAANNAAYDIGHLFGASGGGGNAGCIGCVCTDDTSSTTDKNKGSGFTSPANNIPAGDAFDVDYVAHEIGHQLGATHTFTHSTEDNTSNYEPGSGSTIMAYAGITARDVQMNSDDYFHARSIDMIQTNLGTKTCPISTPITHSAPVVNAGSDYTIPRSTPFVLDGSATDAGGGTLTYCWEQYDEASGVGNLCGDSSTLGDTDCIPAATKTAGPVFRSYSPTTNTKRYFPRLQSVFAGSTTTQGADIITEALPSVGRTLNFRLTVRDNVANGGQTNFDNMVVTVDGTKSPLVVTSHATANQVYAIASTQTVTWSGTGGGAGHNTITGGANVDILFTNDDGATWTTLLANTPNDGSQAVTLPAGVSGAYCRFMVKASGNVFFNVNTASFAVGNYTYQSQESCTDYVFNLNVAIPENSSSFSGWYIPVSDSYTTTDVNIRVEATHSDIGTCFFALRPAHLTTGVVQFFNGSCDGNANLNKRFDDEGSALNCSNTTDGANTIPATLFNTSNVEGQNSAGNWAIFATDINVNGVTGVLNRVTLNLCKTVMVPVLATESFGLQNFVIYPNPNSGNFTVNFTPNSSENVEILVHDLRGRQIYQNKFSPIASFNQEINLKNAQTGIYIVTVKNGDKKEVNKIIVE